MKSRQKYPRAEPLSSMARANKVRYVIEDALAAAGRSDVTFEVYGYGEDPKFSQFENQFPKERFYNRTVIIDVMSGKSVCLVLHILQHFQKELVNMEGMFSVLSPQYLFHRRL